MADTAKKCAKTSIEIECRACLAKICDDSFVDLFSVWDPLWSGMGVSIAEDLVKLANIQISVSDPYSKNICKMCCNRLQEAISFIWSVQNSDIVLRKRHKDCTNEAPSWPRPIQVDKNLTSNAFNEMHVEVKQEIMSDDEYETNETCSEPFEPRLDIKIEPEEITPAPSSIIIEVNGPFSLSQETKGTVNGATEYLDEGTLHEIKAEPMSDDETESMPGMPKDCMLCMKTFNTVKGLKAHVIALHSYDTFTSHRVDRTNVCSTCNRSFNTRTDLFVHETCHSKFACYVCDKKFDTFLLLTKHRNKQCMKTSILPRLKTLDDVRRIARYKGTKSLQLFDLQIPIARIREMKIAEKVAGEINKEKNEKIGGEKHKRKDEREIDENDILHNVLNDNVMSVIVNLRIPCNDKVEPKTEVKELDDKTIISKVEPTDDDVGNLIPKTEPKDDLPDWTRIESRGRRKSRSTTASVDQSSLSGQPTSIKLPTPRGLPISNTKISSEPSSSWVQIDIKPKRLRCRKKKSKNDIPKKKIKEKVFKKLEPLAMCRRKCRDVIPENFRQKVYEHYSSLDRLIERRRFISTLVDCILRTPEDNTKTFKKTKSLRHRNYKHKYYLKFETECYPICKYCLINTLHIQMHLLQSPEKLHIYKTNTDVTLPENTLEKPDEKGKNR